jgi:GT2 family glycosyltransferase
VIRSDAFEEAGGFDEQLAIAFNDVDLCIRLKARGWRVVLAAGAELFHAESVSVGLPQASHRSEQFGRERRLMKDRWGGLLTMDPHYSPNLDLRRPGELAAPPRLPYPWH